VLAQAFGLAMLNPDEYFRVIFDFRRDEPPDLFVAQVTVLLNTLTKPAVEAR
jgi:hypothetical protein